MSHFVLIPFWLCLFVLPSGGETDKRRSCARTAGAEGRRWDGMKKKRLSSVALVKEAAFWTNFRKAAKENPGKLCHK